MPPLLEQVAYYGEAWIGTNSQGILGIKTRLQAQELVAG
jgi:hypothetical protein